jgi:hypothetical protein
MSDSKWWICEECGHEVLASERPRSIKWTDGHVCYFTPNPVEDENNKEVSK